MSGYTLLGPLFDAPPPSEDPAPILARMEARDREWLDGLRAKLRELYEYRRTTWTIAQGPAYVCADDVRRIQRAHPELRTPPGTSNNALGAVFKAPGWRAVGFTRSTTEGSHSNLIRTWVYNEGGDDGR